MFSFDRLLNSFLLKLRELTFRKLHTAQKMKFSIKDFFSKCDQIRSKLGIWSHLLKRSLIENFFFVQCHWNVLIHCAIFFIRDETENWSHRALSSYRIKREN